MMMNNMGYSHHNLGKRTSFNPITTNNNNNSTDTTITDRNDNDDNDDNYNNDIDKKVVKVVEDDSTTNNTTTYCTKIMRITPETFEKLRDFSHKYHDQPISYDEIIEELCSFYNEHHEQKYYF